MEQKDELAMDQRDELAWTVESKGLPNRVTGYVFAKSDEESETKVEEDSGEVEDVWKAWIESGQLL